MASGDIDRLEETERAELHLLEIDVLQATLQTEIAKLRGYVRLEPCPSGCGVTMETFDADRTLFKSCRRCGRTFMGPNGL